MASSRGYRSKSTQAPLARSTSEQLLLRKRQDFNYLDEPSTRPTARDRKAMSDATQTDMQPQHHHHYQQQQQQQQQEQQSQRARSGTAVLSRHGNDQSAASGGGGGGPFRLNKKEKLFLIKRAKESAVALIDHAHTLDGPVQWNYKGKHVGIQMYRGEGLIEPGAPHGAAGGGATPVLGGHNDSQALEFLCGVTTMMGTLEEVSEYFDQASTARMKMKKAEDVVDCAVLYSLVWGNTVNPFHRVSVKYTAYDGPAAMTRPRDFCFLECQDTFRHVSGRRGWVLSMHSIKIPSCPEVPGFVRGSVYHSGFVFVESERPGFMDVMYSLQINFKGHGRVPQFMLNAALKRRLRELIHISREIQVARMAHRTLLQDKDLMPKHLRSSCGNCARKFWLFLRKTRCRVCGEVVCQACAPLVDWECPTGSSSDQHSGSGSGSGGHMKTRICVKCYSTAPTTGTWTAPNDGLPWTEQSRMLAFEKKSSLPMLTPQRTMFRVQEESGDEEDEDDGNGDHGDADEEGRYTFAELEEQSSHSVFAPERFTRSSMASLAPLQIDEIGVDYDGLAADDHGHGDDQYQWQHHHQQRETDESVFHIGSLNSSIMSRDSYFGRPDPSSAAPMPGSSTSLARYSSRQHPLSSSAAVDDTPILMEEPEPHQVSHANASNGHRLSRRYSTPAVPARPPAPAAPPTKLFSSSPNESKSSYDYLDGLIDLPLAKRSDQASGDGARQRSQTTIQAKSSSRNELNPSTLRAHNLRYLRGVDKEPVTTSTSTPQTSSPSPPPPQPTEGQPQQPLPRGSDVPVSLDELVPRSSASRPSSSSLGASTMDHRYSGATSVSSVDPNNSLFSRPSSLILQQVRRNRSRTLLLLDAHSEQEFRSSNEIVDKAEQHRQRMAELNEKAIQYTGQRISTLEMDARPSLAVEPVDDDAWRSSARLEEYHARRKLTIEALRKKAQSMQDDSYRESSGTDRTAASSPSFVGVQRIGEAARAQDQDQDHDQHQVEEQHQNHGDENQDQDQDETPSQERSLSNASTVEELSRPTLDRQRSSSSASSSVSASSPAFAGHKLTGKPSEVLQRGQLENDLVFKPSFSLEFSSATEEEMKPFAVHEEEEGEEEEEEENKDNGKRAGTDGSKQEDERGSPEWETSLEGRAEPEPECVDVDVDLTFAMPPSSPKRRQHNEFVTPRSLYAEIGHLTQLHSEIAMAEDKNEVDRIKERIQDQYQLIRNLQIKP